ncbi:MAG: hypothetical protein FJZ01_14415, partial [Candidatus Sericytochromatia bacterium]|nr:hypothetical protein [Candidatus Tanganyikabacteria bacterium]
MSQQPMMRATIARKLGLNIAALTQDPASGQQLPGLVPTLFVGVGGSGSKILARVKKRLRLGTPEEYNYASFLLIDTDPAALLAQSPQFGPQELLPCAPAEGDDAATALPVRARGHRAYLANYEAVDRALALAYRRVTPTDWRGAAEGPKLHPERTAIVIVGSLWGVTASGMVVDIAYHLGRIAPQAWKAAYLLLPGAYDPLAEQEDPSMAFANAYAALTEINYLSTIDPATGSEGALWVDGPGGEPIKYKGAPWERCYLVEGANADNVAQLYEANTTMISDTLFWDMTFVLGAWKWALRDRLGYAAMRTGGGPFASFGLAALRFPRERVVAFCSRRFTEQLLTRWVGSAKPPEEVTGPKAKPPRGEVDVFIDTHSEWKASGLVKRLGKLKGKGQTSVDMAIAEWVRPLADEEEVKKHGRNVATVLLKEWQRMEVAHFSPKAEAEGFGPRIDGNVNFRAEKYREALEEAVEDRLKYDLPNWLGLQGAMSFLEDLGKRLAMYAPKYEEQLPKLKKNVAEKKEAVNAAGEELTKLCSNPITFPFSGAKVQAAATAFSEAAQAHLMAHLELRCTATAGRLARKLVEECRTAFDHLASARDVVSQARSMVKQQEDPDPFEGDVLRPEALDDLFARAFPPEATGTKKLDAPPSPFQLASKRIAVELGADTFGALLERIRSGEVLPGMLAEIAMEEGRRAFIPFANEIDFVDHFKRTYPAPEEQAVGMADTYFRAAPFSRFEQQGTPAGVVIGVNGSAFTEEGYKGIGPILQAVPLKETEVGLVPLKEGEDEGVVYYREVAGLHITSLPAVTEAQPCYDWIVSQGIEGLHISRPGEPEPEPAPEPEQSAEAAAAEAPAAVDPLEALVQAEIGQAPPAVDPLEALVQAEIGQAPPAVDPLEALVQAEIGQAPPAVDPLEALVQAEIRQPPPAVDPLEALVQAEIGQAPPAMDPLEALVQAEIGQAPPAMDPLEALVQAEIGQAPPAMDPLEALVQAELAQPVESRQEAPVEQIGADPLEAVVAAALRENGSPAESPPAAPPIAPPVAPPIAPP